MIAVARAPGEAVVAKGTVAASETRVAYIDGLRAVAVLGVVFAHSFIGAGYLDFSAAHLIALRRPVTFLDFGIHGVDLFFVLSGFCLSYPTLAKLERSGVAGFDVVSYLARRIVRIMPPFLASIVVLIGVKAALGFTIVPTTLDVLKQALFLDLNTHFVNGVYWTLAVEARWYLVFPLALFVWTWNRRVFWLCLVLLVLAGRLTMASSLDVLMLPAFLLGIAAAGVVLSGKDVRLWAALGLVLALAAAMPVELTEAQVRWPIVGGNAIASFDKAALLWQIAAFCFVLLAASVAPLHWALSLRGLTAIGVASYSIYLVHQPLELIAIHFMPKAPQPVLVVAGLAASLLSGAAFWAVFERPVTNGAARKDLVAFFNRLLARCAAALGTARSFTLKAG